jgi:hypothetical protein
MSEKQVPFLNELRAELRRAAYEQTKGAVRKRTPARAWSLAGAPLLFAISVIAYLVLAAGSPVAPSVPVVDFSGQATAAPLPPPKAGTKVIGNAACLKMVRAGHLPPLVRSEAAPDQALLDELSLLRTGSAPVGRAALGSWDRSALNIATIFERYIRIVNGPTHVKLAFLAVTYCTESEVEPSGPRAPGGVFRESLEQGLVMLVLSNPGEPSPVLVGTAEQIKQGPALAGLDIEPNKKGYAQAWLQAIVVPDGVTKVVMDFTPPFLHHYSATVQIRSNVGIVVRRAGYTPTTVLWYRADGRLIKKFVDRQQLAYDNCLAAHKKSCLSGPSAVSGHGAPAAIYEIATNKTQTGPPALIAQANALYQPVETYEHSVTAAQTSRANAAKARLTTEVNACDAPYQHTMFEFRPGTQGAKLYTLWSDVSGMQNQEVDVSAFAPQLKALAASWKVLSLKNPAMNQFAHAMAGELDTTLNAPEISTCAFVRAAAAHHFSYTWARSSTYGVEAAAWQAQTLKEGNQASAFWRYINPPTLYANTSDVARPGGPGWRLLTQAQSSTLANLPGEIG